MARTRLDEIVEEVARERGCDLSIAYGREDGMEVARRAFRHGVERAIAATDVISGHTFDFSGQGWMNAVEMGVEAARKQMANVQPAPAEETKPTHTPTANVKYPTPDTIFEEARHD